MKTKAMNDNQKLAIKFGVPTFESCQELDWKEETLFTWYSVEGEQYLILTEEFKNSKLYEDVYYPAPQMHEIAKYIPYEIVEDYSYYHLAISEHSDYLSLSYQDIEATYETEYEDSDITDFIQKFVIDGVNASLNHYAEAYAKLYLLLKENQLLK